MKKITQAVILAGGRGTRLRPFTLNNPKPMVPIYGKTFLEHLIKLLKENGIKEVVILTGYFGEKIEKYFGDGANFGIKIKYSYTPFLNEKREENENGVRLKNAQTLLDDLFLLLYCDNYWPFQLNKLVKYFNERNCDLLVTAYSNKDNSTKNNILINEDGFVTNYDSSRTEQSLNGVDIGFFIVNKKVLKLLLKSNSKFEDVVLPKLIRRRRLAGYLSDQKYYSISNPQRVKITEKFLAPKKCILLDRDGVINKKSKRGDYVKKWDEFSFLPGSIEAIKLLNDKGYKIFIISNQPGIAKGKMTEEDLNLIHKKMQQELKSSGAKIDGIYCCPHGWDDGCNCRKPKPGLLFKVSREHFFDLTKSIFIGDDKRDIEAGEKVGCKTILVNTKRNLLQIASQQT